MVFCDTNPNILKWASEELFIPYVSPFDNKMHRYYVDFIIEVKNTNGEIKTYLVEIKPEKQTRQPQKTENKSKRTFLREIHDWTINNKKWEAAKQYAEKNNWEFKIVTEKTLGKMK